MMSGSLRISQLLYITSIVWPKLPLRTRGVVFIDNCRRGGIAQYKTSYLDGSPCHNGLEYDFSSIAALRQKSCNRNSQETFSILIGDVHLQIMEGFGWLPAENHGTNIPRIRAQTNKYRFTIIVTWNSLEDFRASCALPHVINSLSVAQKSKPVSWVRVSSR